MCILMVNPKKEIEYPPEHRPEITQKEPFPAFLGMAIALTCIGSVSQLMVWGPVLWISRDCYVCVAIESQNSPLAKYHLEENMK